LQENNVNSVKERQFFGQKAGKVLTQKNSGSQVDKHIYDLFFALCG
jgi:hypothetical protein